MEPIHGPFHFYLAQFGYPEYFVLSIFGLIVIADASSDSLLKGLLSTIIGVLITTIGMDSLTGLNRFTFGSRELMAGIDQVPVLIGLFGVSEIIKQLFTLDKGKKDYQKIGKIFPGWKLIWKLKGTLFRSAALNRKRRELSTKILEQVDKLADDKFS